MPSLPQTYKAVVVKGANQPLELSDVELKHPSKGEVLVKVLACGVCFTDVSVIHGHMGDLFPRVPGHEIVGEIVEIGDDVRGFDLGQRVGGPWHGGHDKECSACLRGMFQSCDNEAINGVTRNGGWAEYALLRVEALVRIPTDMDPAEVAPLLCAGVTVFNGIRKMHVEQGGLVAVQGLGGLGHLAVQYANKMGYEVVALSSGDDKETFARELGAHHYINTKKTDVVTALKELGGADIIVQTAPNPAIIKDLCRALDATGKLLSLTPIGIAEFDTVALVSKGASIQGWPSGHARDCEDAIKFARLHGVKCMIEKYPFAEAAKSVDDLIAGKPRFRNVLVMN